MVPKKGGPKQPPKTTRAIRPSSTRNIPRMTTPALYRCPKGHVVDENPCPTHQCPTEPYY